MDFDIEGQKQQNHLCGLNLNGNSFLHYILLNIFIFKQNPIIELKCLSENLWNSIMEAHAFSVIMSLLNLAKIAA